MVAEDRKVVRIRFDELRKQDVDTTTDEQGTPVDGAIEQSDR